MIDVERAYVVRDEHGASNSVIVRVFGGASVGEAQWRVYVSVTGLETEPNRPRAVFGADEVQAVLGAFKVARAILEGHPSYAAGRLGLEGAPPRSGLGLEI